MIRRWMLPVAACLTIASAGLAQTITSISPTSAVAGSAAVTVTINGQFPVGGPNSLVLSVDWYVPATDNEQPLTVVSRTSTKIVATIPASLLTTPETAQIVVDNNYESYGTFTVTVPPPTLSSLSPNTAVAGSPALTLTVNGANLPQPSPSLYEYTVTWNGASLATTYVSSTQLTANVPASLLASPGTASVTLSGANPPSPLTFTITPAPLILSSISPTTVSAGGPAFTLTVNGSGYSKSTQATWNGSALTTTFVSAAQLTASVPASLIATPGTASVGVSSTGQTSPSPLSLTITPNPAISSISPSSATAGGAAFTLTVNGSGFGSGVTAYWNSTALSTTVVSAGQLTASIPAALIAQSGTASITAHYGSLVSNSANFTITAPPLVLSSISPNTAVAGGAAFTLTANGSGFSNGAVVTWNGSTLSTSFVSSTQLTASVPASLIATAGTDAVGVSATGQTSSAPLPFTVTSNLTISSISPSSAAAGGPAFTLTLNGSGFNSSTTVLWNSSALTIVSASATQITATVPAALIAQSGSASITAASGNLVSNAATFTITAVPVTLTGISPNTTVAGGPAFTLTATGSAFTNGSLITWNGLALSTAFVSANQLTATVPANLIATAGTASVGVSVPGQTSPAPLTFTITSGLTLSSLSPASTGAGGTSFTLTVNGAGFTSGTTIYWNGAALSTTVVSATQLSATVPPNLISQQGTATVTAQSGTLVSNALTFSITAPQTITLTSLSPSAAVAGSPTFTITVNGSGFTFGNLSTTAVGTLVTWNGTTLTTSFVSSTQLTAQVPANLLTTPGTAAVSVTGSPQPASLSFTILAPLTLTSISPAKVTAGGAAFTLTANGTGFTNTTAITWNGSSLATTFVSSTQLTAAVPANLIASAGTATIDVTTTANESVPAALPLAITANPVLTSLSPASAVAGGPAFTLTVNGSGFASGATVLWNGTALATTYISATQLTAAVSASLIVQTGSASVTASVGGVVSNALSFTIGTPAPVITSISPATVNAGSAALILTVNGTGFVSGAVVSLNGTPLSTTFGSATQVTATVPASAIAQPGSAQISLANPSGQGSNSVTLTITLPVPTITSISPATVVAGGPGFTLTVNGTGFFSGAAVSLNGTALSTTFVSATQLTASVPASLIAKVGVASVTAANTGTAASNAVNLTITVPTPVITSISPVSAAAGSAAFTLNINGSNFVSGAAVSWNATSLTTTFVSATQLTAAVPASLIAQPGTAQITATNAGGTASNAVSFTITVPTPTLSSISPSTVIAGSAATTLTVNGTNFLTGAVVSFNSTALTTTFVSATQLTASVPAGLMAQPGTAQITATNAGGTVSNAVSLTITAPVPTITSLSSSNLTQGGPAFTLTVNGTNFVSGATVYLGTTSLATTFVSSTQLTAAVPASLLQQAGNFSLTVTNPGSAPSNALNFNVYPTPTITSISPSSVTAGGPEFTLTVNGTGFAGVSSVLVNNAPLPFTILALGQLRAPVPANLIAQPGTLQVTVQGPSGAVSNAVTLTVTPALPPPTLTSISPSSVNVGDPAFTLSVIGTGFVQGSIVQWSGGALPTTFISATQLTATVNAGLLVLPTQISVNVVNQVPNGTPLFSNPLPFSINPVTPTITSLSPNSTVVGGPAFSLSVTGTGFLSLTSILWNTITLTTHFVSSTSVTADVPASLIAQTGTVGITAINPGNSFSAAFTFTINPPPPPVITSLSQTSATAGAAAFTLTVTGTGFASGAVVNLGANALTTTFVSATQLTAAVPANLLLTPGTDAITVQQTSGKSNAENFTIGLPAPPSLLLSAPTTSGPAQQPTIGFGLNSAYPLVLNGTVTLTFASNATVPSDDPSIQFAGGGRTFTFTVPANTTTLPALLIQTGTVAGVITLNVSFTAAGVNVTPTSGTSATITVAKAAPVIQNVSLIHANGYLAVDITGFSTTRDMSTAVFQLNAAPGGSFTSSVITVPVSSLFSTWYTSATATAFGSQFTYAQPFTVIGDTNQIASVTVTLTNSSGTSTAATSH